MGNLKITFKRTRMASEQMIPRLEEVTYPAEIQSPTASPVQSPAMRSRVMENRFVQEVPKIVYRVHEMEIINPRIINLPDGVTFNELVAQKKIWLTKIPVEVIKEVPKEKVITQEIPAGPRVVFNNKAILLNMQDPKITFNEVMYTQGMIVCIKEVIRKEVQVEFEVMSYKGKL